jgi:hypothetical protein
LILLRAGCSWEPHTVIAALVALALIPFVGLVSAAVVVAGGVVILVAGGRRPRGSPHPEPTDPAAPERVAG